MADSRSVTPVAAEMLHRKSKRHTTEALPSSEARHRRHQTLLTSAARCRCGPLRGLGPHRWHQAALARARVVGPAGRSVVAYREAVRSRAREAGGVSCVFGVATAVIGRRATSISAVLASKLSASESLTSLILGFRSQHPQCRLSSTAPALSHARRASGGVAGGASRRGGPGASGALFPVVRRGAGVVRRRKPATSRCRPIGYISVVGRAAA